MNREQPDLNDPFTVGQFVGMLVILTFIEKNNGIPKDFLEKLKKACVEKSAVYMNVPEEDLFLFVDSLVNEIKEI